MENIVTEVVSGDALFTFTATMAMAVPVVIGLVQVLKGTFAMVGRYGLLASLLLGVGFMWLVSPEPLKVWVLQGILVGLTASGVYSGTKATFK